ncbi:MAG: class I tRNA ligase family protein, partial [Acetobacteraceae bacterium]|nr:class I tRNA ligase family protein [Acetobacteraceae bacterium]
GRFALSHLREEPPPVAERQLIDRWILSRLERTRAAADEMLGRFDLGEAARLLHEFFWGELCDWYLEFSKGCLYGREGEAAAAARRTLWEVLDRTLRLLHPFVPFITEEIWQHLPHHGPSLAVAEWPQPRPQDLDPEAESRVGLVVEVTRAIRNLRAEVRVPPGKPSEVLVVAPQAEARAALQDMAGHIRALGGADPLRIVESVGSRPRQALAAVVPGAEVYLPLQGLVDVEREVARLRRELDQAESDHARSRARLDDPGFRRRAPAEVVQKEEEREAALRQKAEGLRRRLEELGS